LLPLVDTHCHLLAGLDDGPESWDEAIEMCQIAWDDGVHAIAAAAHQNEMWPEVNVERILATAQELSKQLDDAGVPLTICPCAEVMVTPDMDELWRQGSLLSVSNGRRYLLIELPHGLFVDLRWMVSEFVSMGVRPILAHPERHPEILHGAGVVEELIGRGCLIQVAADSVTQNDFPPLTKTLRSWARRGVIHLVGSDGHSPTRRPPGIAAAYYRLAEWAGNAVADRICSVNGMAVLEGLPLEIPPPKPPKRRWFSRIRV